jgi:hypothetical protein
VKSVGLCFFFEVVDKLKNTGQLKSGGKNEKVFKN